MLPGHLASASWHVAIPQDRTEEQTNSPQLEHQDAATNLHHLIFVQNVLKTFQRAGDFHHAHGPGRHSLFL